MSSLKTIGSSPHRNLGIANLLDGHYCLHKNKSSYHGTSEVFTKSCASTGGERFERDSAIASAKGNS